MCGHCHCIAIELGILIMSSSTVGFSPLPTRSKNSKNSSSFLPPGSIVAAIPDVVQSSFLHRRKYSGREVLPLLMNLQSLILRLHGCNCSSKILLLSTQKFVRFSTIDL
ncbi:hypothetical protein ACJIZ3_008928 [Penstemon smallii]|uniref:Uncharacterized protein n=1 Tax=Penstemon smallii TaxID=265156 RepID=A0ABD3TBK5_9LAMI